MTTTKSKSETILWSTNSNVKRLFNRQWNTQPTPFRNPLEFHFLHRNVDNAWGSQYPGSVPYRPDCADSSWFQSLNTVAATNQCYSNFISKTGDVSTWANNLHEANQSIATIVTRAGQLGRAVNALRKGNVKDLITILGNPSKDAVRTKRGQAKSLADQWLEWHFGWEPLIKDISDAIEILQSADFGTRRVRSAGKSRVVTFTRRDSSNDPGNYRLGEYFTLDRKSIVEVRMGADIRISNPNAYLANQMGFVNAASVVWEAIPYSFLVDWVANVGQILASMTDFVGLSLLRAYTTTFSNMTDDQQKQLIVQPNVYRFGGTFVEVRCNRLTSITGPTFKLRPFSGLSVTRGATAIALLLQKL